MTFAKRPQSHPRTLLAFATSLLTATALHAQPQIRGNGYTPTFAAMTQSDIQANRTAQLLAATQPRNTAPVVTSNPAMKRMGEGFTVTRQSAGDTAAASYVITSASNVPPPAASYSNNTGLIGGSNVIPSMPDARPGECFALVKLPERFNTYQREYEVRSASERLETVAPRYEVVTEQYVVQEAYERMEVVPATFRMVTEQMEVAAPSTRYVTSEPVYETVTERVLEQPARTVWKPGRGPIQRLDHATGEIMCLVEEPAVYKSVTRRVLKAAAEAREVQVPGQYSLVTRRVLDRPAEVRRVVVPQQLATRNVRRLVEPGALRRVPIPAQLGTTTVRELVEPARLEWRSVLCETNMTTGNIQRVQAALLREGYNPGPVNGSLNGQTIAALNQYQRARNLPQDQYLNMETVRALGVM